MLLTNGLKKTARRRGDQIASWSLVGERAHTWGEVENRVARMAGGLRGLGLKAGARIAVLALNCDRYLECYYAIPWAGCIMVPINTRLAPPEMTYIINDAGCEALFFDEAFQPILPDLRKTLTTVKHYGYMGEGEGPGGILSYEKLIADAEPAPDAAQDGQDLAAIFYTGGTTGLPKGVMLSHWNLTSSAMAFVIEEQLNDETVYIHTAPTFHVGDGAMTYATTMGGGSHVFIPRFDPEQFMQVVAARGVTHCFLVPTMINMVINHPAFPKADLSSLRKVHYAASSMPAALLAQAMEVLPHCAFSQGYGMTETSPATSFLRPDFHVLTGPLAGKIASAGQAAPHALLKIVDLEDNALPPGEVGEICTRGPHIMQGYWNKPEVTAETLRGGWMHTGDMGYLDDEGFLYIVDRLKDMIITGGENVYSAEVENAVYQYPGVGMCAVIGLPDEKWGEAVHAIVVPKEGEQLDGEAIMAFCRERLAGYKCPRSVEIRLEPLPLSGAAKILKHELRSAAIERMEKEGSNRKAAR